MGVRWLTITLQGLSDDHDNNQDDDYDDIILHDW